MQALVGDRRQNRLGLWRDISVAFNAKEVCRTAFVDVFLFLRVQIDGAGVSQLFGFGKGEQACCIVAADFDGARSLGSGAVVVPADHHIDRLESILEVGTYRSHEHQKQVFVCGLHADFRAHADEQRTNVKSVF